MKKILLVSMMHNVTELVKEIEPELPGKTVTYIPTTGIAEEIEGMADDYQAVLVENDTVKIYGAERK